jgi:signal transduction histidine kinase
MVLIHTDSTSKHLATEEQKCASAVLKVLADTTAVLHRSVDLLEGKSIHRRVARHARPDGQIAMDIVRDKYGPKLGSDQPSSRAIRTGKTEYYPTIFPEQIIRMTQNEDHANVALRIGMRSLISVPLRIRGEVIGSFTFLMTEGRLFDLQAVDLAEELARRAAVAIDNARLYRDTRQAVQQRDEFISIASHELKTPLTTLKLHGQLAARQLANDPANGLNREYSLALVDTINRQMTRLNRLIEDMLDISRITTGKLTLERQDLDLSQLVREVAARFRVQIAADGIELRFFAPSPVPVRDFGVGIAAEDQARIFERFERASSVSLGGLGLGLYISRDIAHAHGGEIHVRSERGKGVVFTLELQCDGSTQDV